jgi:hypothetical protein
VLVVRDAVVVVIIALSEVNACDVGSRKYLLLLSSSRIKRKSRTQQNIL